MRRRIRMSRVVAAGLLIPASLFLSGCEYFSSPQNTFAPAGEVAEQQKNDFLLVMWPSLVIGLIVLIGLLVIAVKFRHKDGDPMPKQIHGNTALELTWTIIPIILLAIIAVPTVEGIRELARDPGDDALDVKVTGVQWAWLFEYPGIEAGGAPLTTPVGELRIPVGQEIDLEVRSTDVNHSFWIPKLAGKIDAINNHVNRMWFQADRPGEYVGQCAEFCGLDHYNMRMKVIAMPQDEFDAWVVEQQAEAQRRIDGDNLLASNGE